MYFIPPHLTNTFFASCFTKCSVQLLTALAVQFGGNNAMPCC